MATIKLQDPRQNPHYSREDDTDNIQEDEFEENDFEKEMETAIKKHETTKKRDKTKPKVQFTAYGQYHLKSVHQRPTSAKPRGKNLNKGKDLMSSAIAELNQSIDAKLSSSKLGMRKNEETLKSTGGSNVIPKRERPISAPVARPVTRTITDKTKNSSIGYLRKAQKEKAKQQRDFAKALQQDNQKLERKVALRMQQANKLFLQLGIKRCYNRAAMRDGLIMLKLRETLRDGQVVDRMITAETFFREFDKFIKNHNIDLDLNYSAAPDAQSGGTRQAPHPSAANPVDESTHNSNAKVTTKMSKKETQEELRKVLRKTIELSATLTEQLHELKRKGWNCSNVEAISLPGDSGVSLT